MLVALVVLVVIGAFILGSFVTWSIKPHIDAYVDNAAYAKAIIHPEMLDDNGNILRDELIYITRDNDFLDEPEDIDEDDDE
ncbi:hypothetical protein SShM2_223 [Synechococcus phage S-ShM2]|uniref:Uncharacterized protein n=3 Tax=Ahtivirus sagseatwo TaxID=2734079 RepID=A0A1D7SK27_9CAUD|nr:hypothetical protein SShM2_223 [Synechococcus phage S-ShM2]AGH57347.1 hypothetical protein CPLG_00093 [Cyanophage S-SSM2]AOO13322.1 hypothetical protein LIS021110_209 [Cyanophage S-RIM14]ADO97833.1 hypothetical protein SShM2_223 [Synechococcus phage S-ShM2]AOO13538.1 hypothetical protein LIS110610_209 [Cyanophage S-RIM14]AOO13754.1 hypothetical protein Np111211_209 [Cyanophage S-RIM14]